MRIEKVSFERINPAAYNPRKDLKPGDPEYEKLRKSLNHWGLVEPLVWNQKTSNLVGGHQRFKILKELGFTEVEVVVVDLSPDEERALNIALNKITGDWDEAKLAQVILEIQERAQVDINLLGFDRDELDDVLSRYSDLKPATGNDDDFDVDGSLDTSKPAITQEGELLELGEHRLLCGDSTNPDHVRRVMNGERATLFATDPPYLVGYDGTNHPGKSRALEKRKNKNWSGSYGITWDDADANPDLYDKFIGVAVAEAIIPEAAWYCWHASRRQMMVESMWQKHGAFVHQQIVWVKDRPILNRSWYTWQHEPCFFGWIKGQKPRRVAKDYPPTVWNVPTVRAGERTDHPTSKPVELFRIPMRQHTQLRDICYEPFCGSGSQLIAAQELGRRCFGLELSSHYCDVIVRRWLHYVGPDQAPPELVKRYAKPAVNESEAA